MNKNDLEQSIIDDLKYISFNTNETEFYDMLMYIFETLNKFNLIDNESYDEMFKLLDKKRDERKYYKKYIEYKERALKAEKKLKNIEIFIKNELCSQCTPESDCHGNSDCYSILQIIKDGSVNEI